MYIIRKIFREWLLLKILNKSSKLKAVNDFVSFHECVNNEVLFEPHTHKPSRQRLKNPNSQKVESNPIISKSKLRYFLEDSSSISTDPSLSLSLSLFPLHNDLSPTFNNYPPPIKTLKKK